MIVTPIFEAGSAYETSILFYRVSDVHLRLAFRPRSFKTGLNNANDTCEPQSLCVKATTVFNLRSLNFSTLASAKVN